MTDHNTEHRDPAARAERAERRWRFGRADYLLLRVALAVTVVAALGYLLPYLLDWLGGRPLQVQSVTSAATPAVAGVATRDGATVTYGPQLTWSLPHASVLLWVLNLVPRALTSAVVVAGAVLLWRLVSAVRNGQPFGRSGLRTVRMLGVLVLLWSVSVPLLGVAATTFTVFEARVDPEVELRFVPWSFAPIVVGLLLLVLAEVFRLGARLQDDVEGLV